MKNTIVILLALSTCSVFAGSSPVSLVCKWDNHPSPSSEECVITVNIPTSGTVAFLDPKTISNNFVDICYTAPHVNKKFITTASTGNDQLASFSYSDPNRNTYIWDNKYLDVNNSMTYGYYELKNGFYSLAYGQMHLKLDIPTRVKFDFKDSMVMRNVGSATVTTPWGKPYYASCHLGYYHE